MLSAQGSQCLDYQRRTNTPGWACVHLTAHRGCVGKVVDGSRFSCSACFLSSLEICAGCHGGRPNCFELNLDLASSSEDELQDLARRSNVVWMGMARKELVLNLRESAGCCFIPCVRDGHPETNGKRPNILR